MLIHRQSLHRDAFSLIELLVVIAILGTLFTVAGYAYFRTGSTQQLRAAEQTLEKMHVVLHSQIKAETDKARDANSVNDYLLGLAYRDQVRAKILRTKLGLRVAFPQSFAEAKSQGAGGISYSACGVPVRSDMFNAVKLATNATDKQELFKEAAACLYIALNRGENANGDILAGTGKTKEIVIGTRTFQVYVDIWGTPISFYRWGEDPVRWAPSTFPDYVVQELDVPPLARATGGTTGVRTIDPIDPEGFLLPPAYVSPQMEALVGHKFATPHNWMPHLISAGPDKLYGTSDDIMSFQVK